MKDFLPNALTHSPEHCLHGVACAAADGLAQRLQQAEQTCAAQGARLTPQRRQVLGLVLSAGQPVGAYELMARLGELQGKPAAPPTVYRALDFLLEQGLIHRLSSLNAFVPCCHFRDRHEAVFLICERCQRVQEASPQSVFGPLQDLMQAGDFRPRTALMELLGLCVACQALA
jgi:Fur family zinc uptake transcriptional regulator